MFMRYFCFHNICPHHCLPGLRLSFTVIFLQIFQVLTGPETPPRILNLLLNPGLWSRIQHASSQSGYCGYLPLLFLRKLRCWRLYFHELALPLLVFLKGKKRRWGHNYLKKNKKKPHNVMWSPVVPDVKQTSARSSGAGGCNQVRHEKMKHVATGRHFGTLSLSSHQHWGDSSAASCPNSPVVQRGCLFPEPVKKVYKPDTENTLTCQ